MEAELDAENADHLSSFPDEMLLSIFIGLGLDLVDLTNVFAVCKRWNRLSELIFARVYAKAVPSATSVLPPITRPFFSLLSVFLSLATERSISSQEVNVSNKDALFKYLKELGKPSSSGTLMTKLSQALYNREENKIRRFIEMGVDVNDKFRYADYPIRFVTSRMENFENSADTRILRLLLSAGADERLINDITLTHPRVQQALEAFRPTEYKREKSAILRGWQKILPKIQFLQNKEDSESVTSLLYTKAERVKDLTWIKCDISGLPHFGEYSSEGDRLSGEWVCYHGNLTSNRLCIGTWHGRLYCIDLGLKKISSSSKYKAEECGEVNSAFNPPYQYSVKNTTFMPNPPLLESIDGLPTGKPTRAQGYSAQRIDSQSIEIKRGDKVVTTIEWDEEERGQPHFVFYGKARPILLIISRFKAEVWRQVDS